MDVLIKNMEMPKNYPYRITIHSDGHVEEHSRYSGHGHYQAIPVPEHGDLIDRDALVNSLSADDRDIYVEELLNDSAVVLEGTT